MFKFSLGYVRRWGKCYHPSDSYRQKCQRKPRQDGKDRRRIDPDDLCLAMPEPQFWTDNNHREIYVPVGGKRDRYIHLHCVCPSTWQKVVAFLLTPEGQIDWDRLAGWEDLSDGDRQYVTEQIEQACRP